ncbi:hypothetical protein [Leptospira levettii]|nr:hypothetical protein [Leptospira levettii]
MRHNVEVIAEKRIVMRHNSKTRVVRAGGEYTDVMRAIVRQCVIA